MQYVLPFTVLFKNADVCGFVTEKVSKHRNVADKERNVGDLVQHTGLP
jgi:hypothetical protein